MSTISLFLLSSVLYALVPVAILLFGDGKPQSALNVLAMTVAMSCLLAGKIVTRANYRAALLDKRLFWMSLLQTLGFLGFLAFIFLAQDHSEALFTLIVAESWPLFSAVLFPLFVVGHTKKLTLFEYLVGVIAILGLAFVTVPNDGDLTGLVSVGFAGIIFPILATLAMAFSVTFKAMYVQRAADEHGILAVESFFLMYQQMLPVLLLGLVLFPVDISFQTLSSVPLATVISLLNVGSAIIFSLGTLKIMRATDLYIWFFTPVFSVLFYCLATFSAPAAYDIAGLGLIVGCNLLVTLDTERRVGYRYGILGLMITGAACIALPVAPMEHYYDSLAVLAIFSTITLTFMLDRTATRSAREAALFSDICRSLDPMAQRATIEKVRAFYDESRLHLLKRQLRQLRSEIADPSAYEKLARLASSRARGLNVSNLFSVAAAILAIFLLSISSRPEGWQHAFFALAFVPSVIYGFFYLIDLNRQRFQVPYYPIVLDGAVCYTLPEKSSSRREQSSSWAMTLILFLVICFGWGFYLGDGANRQIDAEPTTVEGQAQG